MSETRRLPPSALSETLIKKREEAMNGLIRLALAGAAFLTAGNAFADGWRMRTLVPGSAFHGVHGLAVDNQGRLLAASVVGQAIYEVKPNGKASVLVPPPQGMADDIAIAPDGTMAWTGFLTGDIYSKKGDGPIRKLAAGLAGINSIAYRADGRLYASQVFLGDALYEIDPEGVKPPRKLMEGMGGLNGFEIRDNYLYGPLWFKGQIVRINLDAPHIEVIADGLQVPAAANLDSKGNIFVVDTKAGTLVKIDAATRAKSIVAKLKTGVDNLAIDKNDRIFVANMVDNAVQEVNPRNGRARTILSGKLAMPSGLAITSQNGRDTLHVGDVFAYRTVDGATGKVTTHARMQGDLLEYPMSAGAGAGKVALSSWFTGTAQVFDAATGKSLSMIHGLKAPHDAVPLPDGSLLISEYATGTLIQKGGRFGDLGKPLAIGLITPNGLAVAGDSVYVTETMAGLVSRIDLNTGAKTIVAQGLKMPKGVAMMKDGVLAVVEAGAKRLVEIGKDGKVSEIGRNLPIGLPAAAGTPPSYLPNGVAIGASGAIYMTSDLDNSILKFTRK
jgi:sugar lactone lactonase YvrE